MTADEFLTYHRQVCEQMHATTVAKNHDYTGDSSDPFVNFRIIEALGAGTAEQGFITRMSDKLSRLSALTCKVKEAYVQDESIEDTLVDLANYCILMAAYLKDKHNDNVTTTVTGLACSGAGTFFRRQTD